MYIIVQRSTISAHSAEIHGSAFSVVAPKYWNALPYDIIISSIQTPIGV